MPQAGEVRERVRGQQSEAVPREVQEDQAGQAAPAHGGGEVRQGGAVVERAAEVELQEGTARDAEGLRVDQGQRVAAEVQGAQTGHGGEGVGAQLCDPGRERSSLRYCVGTFWCFKCTISLDFEANSYAHFKCI